MTSTAAPAPFQSFGQFAAEQRQRASAATDAAVKDIKTSMAEQTAAEQPQPPAEPGMDPWDVPNAGPQPAPADENTDPFDQYRNVRGHALEAPESTIGVKNWSEDSMNDFGRAAAASGVPQAVAQGLLGLYAEAVRGDAPGQYGYDADASVHILREEWGSEKLHENLAAINAFVAARPALAAWLDSSGMGDSPQVLRMLAGIAHQPEILDPAKAQAYIAKVKANPSHAYWKGDKTAVATMRAAYAIAG